MAGCFAAPDAEADPGYLYGAYYPAYPALYNAFPDWPGVSAPGFSSTCFGCRVKRSADAEPEADASAFYGYYGYPYAYGYGYPYGYLNGVAGHPDGTSYTYRSVQGIGKRSADAEPVADADAYYHYGYPYAYGYGYPYAYGYGYPVATSYEARSPQGLGKRSADAEPEAEADAYYGYPYAYGYGYPRAYSYSNFYGYHGYPYGYGK